jgi:biopolymer transport protein ExbD
MTNTSQGKWEPNLVPMLDMVLQMVMFFMLCANFAQDELSEKVKLPKAVEARALDKFTDRVVFVNLYQEKDPKTGGERWYVKIGPDVEENAFQVQRTMENRLASYRAGLRERDTEKTPLVVLRADERAEWKRVHEVMAACKRAGYGDVQLRVTKVVGDR